MYETSMRTLSLRVPDEPGPRLAALLALVESLPATEPALVQSR
jgi:hypothetical protein